MRRIICCLLIGLIFIGLAGCGKSPNKQSAGDADEDAALSHSEFVAPILLHIDRDGFSEAQRLRALNGVSNFGPDDLNQAGGLNDFPPCAEQGPDGIRHAIDVNIIGYNFDMGVVAGWMRNNRFIEFETYNLRYPKFASKAPAVFVCPILNDNVGKYLPSNQARNIHNGIDIPIGRRILTKWTYRNRYETPAPGRGNVKVFAGTFTYKIDPIIPIVSFSGEGTATVKLYIDPDNGRWTVDSWEQHDPGITLLTNPLEPSKATALAPQAEAGRQGQPPGPQANMTPQPAVNIRTASCTQVSAGLFKVEMSGEATGPSGTYFFYAVSNPSSGVDSMLTSCDSWSRTGSEDGPRNQNICKHQSSESTQTRWSSSNILNSQQPPKEGTVVLFYANPDGTGFRPLVQQRVPLVCQPAQL